MAKIDTPETIADETTAAPVETPPEADKFRRQYSTIVTDEALVAELDDLSLVNKHRNPSDLVRAALASYAEQNRERLAKFREFMGE
jgi:hypothetical protein